MRLCNARGESIRRWYDWPRPKKKSQWRSGRSAMELARAWFTSSEPVVPPALRILLDGNPLTRRLQIDWACPEKVTDLPEKGLGRNHDLVLRGRARGHRVTVCIEAKVDERFDKYIGPYYDTKTGTRSRVPQRIDTLCQLLFGNAASGGRTPWRDLRYQLVTGAAGAVLEAAGNGSELAVFIVHEFLTDRADRRKRVPQNQVDYTSFVRLLLRGRVDAHIPGRLYGPLACRMSNDKRIDLLIGKIVDDWPK